MRGYGELLKRFCVEDEMRHWMSEPFKAHRRAIATNARILVAAPLYDSSLPDYSDKVKSVYPAKCNCEVSMPTAKLNSILDKWPKTALYDYEYKECEACNGDGEVEFEFFHGGKMYEVDEDCPVCGGEGEIEIKPPTPNGQYKLNRESLIQVADAYFDPNYIKDVLDIALFLEVKTIRLVRHDSYNRPVMFHVAEIEVLIMPMLNNDGDGVGAKLFQPQTSTP